jgi:multisubunit Na+/H+ antiporter MnhE subunit
VTALALNTALALIWFFLGDEPTPDRFVVGFITGFLIVAAFERALPNPGYARRVLAFFRFLLVFTRELVMANLTMARAIALRRRAGCVPALVEYPAAHLTRTEILLLTHCITLTPGTTTVEITPDFKTLVLHAYDGADPQAVVAGIRSSLEASITAFLR